MKKAYIALAVLSMAALLVSCQETEIIGDTFVPEKGDIVFGIANNAKETKSSNVETVIKGETFDLGSDDQNNFYLEETIVDLNNLSYSPDTKGTPAYTENLGVLYADDMNVYGDKGSFTTPTTFVNVENEMYPRKGSETEKGWRYHHVYASDPWPASGEVGFYLNMPAAPNGLTINSKTGGKFSISYTTPEAVADQQDILFAYRSMDKATHDSFLPNGAPVLFNHALTGVKFAIANYDADKKITIKSVSFTGLVGTATCVITPAVESDYSDVTATYSSGTESVVKWTIPETPDRSKTYSSGEFGAPVKYDTGGSFGDKGKYPDSFAQAGNTNNLNKADASQTFWFIPQAMTNDIKLTIVYTYGSTTERTGVLEFGKVLAGKNVTWKAGELRTYTIRVDEVNVKIEDTVEPTEEKNKVLTDLEGNIIYTDEVIVDPETGEPVVDPETGEPTHKPYTYTYYGGTKSDVVITNTGNTDAFIRAALIGQWLDEDGNPVFGFTDYTAGEVKLVDSWYRDQFVTKARKHGSFVGLVGYADDYPDTGKWVLCEDGYYYYTAKVPAGDPIPSSDPLFVSYTVDKNPAVAVAGKVNDIYFTLEIATQAVTAKQTDGSDYDWDEAWKNALGEKPVVAE
jgi:hypothetical protein